MYLYVFLYFHLALKIQITVNVTLESALNSSYSAVTIRSESQPNGCEVTTNQSCMRELENHHELLKVYEDETIMMALIEHIF